MTLGTYSIALKMEKIQIKPTPTYQFSLQAQVMNIDY